MSASMTLRMPLPPNLANARMHWRTKERKRQEYFATCDMIQAVVKEFPRPPREPLQSVRATAVLTVNREHDDDNAFLRAYKFPLDWLKTRGYIVDDNRKCVRCEVPEQVITRSRACVYVEITLTPIDS